ncbi:hypothetical protein [Sphingomonas oligophenolica]|uniref:Uncharacterized protein n=1 Tax=Sphingomonas oligophenolica TaxID=301154 RepID=A0A502CS84_9SPHN|nr:hypothetical protein [Sphingomonas oligophenolica]TPG15534.1 hypothetical protein EAH84_01670 [Sphingomonas oligophenolica]
MPDQLIVSPRAKLRHDAFDGKLRQVFLDALQKCGCLRDAARRAGVSHQTIYNHQARDKEFAKQCDLALHMVSTGIELHAWERGVVGVEEPIVYRGEVVGTRLKRSDAILRLLLQGAKPKKYGPNPGFGRRRLHKLERKRIEREVRDELRARKAYRAATAAETDAALQVKLDALARHTDAKRLAAGWTRLGEDWIPPGWVRSADAPAPVPAGSPGDWPYDGAEQILDSV